MKRVLLTGVSGFVGSHVLRYLLKKTDWHILGVASWKHKGTPERVQLAVEGIDGWKQRLDILTHDLISPFTETTMRDIGRVDYVVNIASESHVFRSITEPVYFIENNVGIITTMLELARVKCPDVFLQFSTDEVYGVAPKGVNYREWSPLVPSNAYSASKAAQEVIAISYWRTYGVPLVITNTMNIFGETQDREKFIPMLIHKIANGQQVTIHGAPGNIGSRFYLHARNCADALLFLLHHKPALFREGRVTKPDRFNVVGEVELDNLTLAQMVAKMVGKPLKYKLEDFHKQRPGHDRRYALSGAKLRKCGWRHPVPFRESLETTVAWTLDNPQWI